MNKPNVKNIISIPKPDKFIDSKISEISSVLSVFPLNNK